MAAPGLPAAAGGPTGPGPQPGQRVRRGRAGRVLAEQLRAGHRALAGQDAPGPAVRLRGRPPLPARRQPHAAAGQLAEGGSGRRPQLRPRRLHGLQLPGPVRQELRAELLRRPGGDRPPAVRAARGLRPHRHPRGAAAHQGRRLLPGGRAVPADVRGGEVPAGREHRRRPRAGLPRRRDREEPGALPRRRPRVRQARGGGGPRPARGLSGGRSASGVRRLTGVGPPHAARAAPYDPDEGSSYGAGAGRARTAVVCEPVRWSRSGAPVST
ncbi:hypothetical protein SGPA1_10715 [Streptomyces misionensis JCM 4497]